MSAKLYSQFGFPWFDLYDESKGDVAPSNVLAGVKSVAETYHEHGFVGQQDDDSVAIPAGQTVVLGKPKNAVDDGTW